MGVRTSVVRGVEYFETGHLGVKGHPDGKTETELQGIKDTVGDPDGSGGDVSGCEFQGTTQDDVTGKNQYDGGRNDGCEAEFVGRC